MRQLSEILEEIADGPAVRFAALVTKDGFVIESSASASEGDEMAASRAAQVFSAAESAGEELQGGEPRQIVTKYQKGLLVVDCLDSETLLVSAVANESSMAWIKFAVGKCLPELSQRL
jgi:predicted regulator of Ras-like GTPase activity (Roadblock/LC7/MglB family)